MDKNRENISLHTGHRKRMLSKFVKLGSGGFSSHELLEMLLYFAIPRKNTNEIAHRMIASAGSLDSVFTADMKRLEAIDGVGEKSALLIMLTRSIMVESELERLRKIPLKSEFLLKNYFHLWYKAKERGYAMALMLDCKSLVIDELVIAFGNRNRYLNYPDVIRNRAKELGAAKVILSHNHKNNVGSASVEDMFVTGAIRAALALDGIELVEHYIVTDTDVFAVSEQK